MKYPAPRRTTDADLSKLDRPPAPLAPVPYWQLPDWEAFLRAMRESPGSITERLVAADFLEENGAPERAAFVRERARLFVADKSAIWNVPSRVIREWFALGGLKPNTAQTGGNTLNYYSHLTEGDYAFPYATLLFFCGFADSLNCDALTLTRAMDDLYAREPVREVHVREWSHEGADGKPVVYVDGFSAESGTFNYRVAGAAVSVSKETLEKRQQLSLNPERGSAECAFEARWPGVEFVVNI